VFGFKKFSIFTDHYTNVTLFSFLNDFWRLEIVEISH
jgi:hypothetical protein